MNILIVNAVEWGPEHLQQNYPCDCGQWIMNTFDGKDACFTAWRIQKESSLPAGRFDAVVISGSPASAYDPFPWIQTLCGMIRAWVDRQLPLFGACFGHQVIAHGLGVKI